MQSEKPDLIEELAACPFCGKQPASQWFGACGEDDDCGYWGIDCCLAHSHADSEEDAAAAWNQRAILPIIARHQATAAPVQGELAGLVKKLRRTKTEHRIRSGFGGLVSFHDETETREVPINPDGPEAATAIEALSRQFEAGARDTARLDYLASESYDLRSFDVPTGGGDADVGWRVVGHWQAEPCDRTIAEVYHDDPRAAIDGAIDPTTLEV